MADDAAYRCKSAFAHFDKNGQPFVITPGTLVKATDSAYKANPDAFESVGDHIDAKAARRSRVEQATAAPGEVRDVTPPAKSGK